MCGLAGFVQGSGFVAAEAHRILARQGASLSQRGPDGEGLWMDEVLGVALVHRRLAILDLSEAGHQPMRSGQGRHQAVFNGEIYNYQAIRGELLGLGHRFKGHSDTEVLLAACDQWGIEAALRRCIGMFAVAIVDLLERQLVLARDRAGEKPLLVAQVGDTIIFGSDLRALQQHPRCPHSIDRQSVALLLRHGYVPAPRSIVEGIHKVLPGSLMRFDLRHPERAPGEVRFWNIVDLTGEPEAPVDGGGEAGLDLLERTLQQVVQEQLVSDRPIGAFLSGGVDSSLVTALMQRSLSQPVRTFSIGFEEPEYDESPWSRAVAAHLGTVHSELIVTADQALAVIPEALVAYDEPFADTSQLPTLLLSRFAREQVVVALSGDGGDEGFGGYPRYQATLDRWRQQQQRSPRLRRMMGSAARGAAELPGVDSIGGLINLMRAPVGPPRSLRGWFNRQADELLAGSIEQYYEQSIQAWRSPERHVLGATNTVVAQGARPEFGNGIRRLMAWDIEHYLPDDLLVKVDRASMAFGLEVRAPLIDVRVLTAAWRLNEAFLRHDGIGKYPLRALLYRRVPRALIDRPKRGFAAPIASWLRGPLKDWAGDLLRSQAFRESGLVDQAEMKRRWDQHQREIWDNAGQIWSLAVLAAWIQRPVPQNVSTQEVAA